MSDQGRSALAPKKIIMTSTMCFLFNIYCLAITSLASFISRTFTPRHNSTAHTDITGIRAGLPGFDISMKSTPPISIYRGVVSRQVYSSPIHVNCTSHQLYCCKGWRSVGEQIVVFRRQIPTLCGHYDCAVCWQSSVSAVLLRNGPLRVGVRDGSWDAV
jgi:hypothetical protein